MRWAKVVRCLPLITRVSNRMRTYESYSLEQNYRYLQEMSLAVLKKLGYGLKVSGLEHIKEEPILFVSNHQGTLDPALIVGSCPVPLSFVSKKENEKIPVLGKCALSIGTIHFDRESRQGNVAMLRTALRTLKAGRNICLFPEGTRSMGDAMNPFKVGSLQIAKMSRVTIVPITLNYAYDLDGGCPNHKQLEIHYGQPISYDAYRQMDEEELRDYVYRQIEMYVKK